MTCGEPNRSLYFSSFIVRRRATYCSAYLGKEKWMTTIVSHDRTFVESCRGMSADLDCSSSVVLSIVVLVDGLLSLSNRQLFVSYNNWLHLPDLDPNNELLAKRQFVCDICVMTDMIDRESYFTWIVHCAIRDIATMLMVLQFL